MPGPRSDRSRYTLGSPKSRRKVVRVKSRSTGQTVAATTTPSGAKRITRARKVRRDKLARQLRREEPEAFESADILGRQGEQAAARRILAERRQERREAEDSLFERAVEGGVVGLFDEDLSAKGREALYGTANPSAEQLALMYGTGAGLGFAGKLAGRVGGKVLGRGGARLAKKLEDAPIKPASKPTRAVRKVKATKPAKSAGKAAKTKPGRIVTSPARHVARRKVAYGTTGGALGAYATAKTGDPSEFVEAPARALGGIAKGFAEAPGQTLEATARAVPGILTATGALVANPALSAYRATQTAIPGGKSYTGEEIAEPTRRLVEEEFAGLKEMADTYATGSVDEIAEATKEDYGLTPLAVALPPITRAARGPYRKVRGAAREKTAERRAQGKRKVLNPTQHHAPVEFDPERPVFDAAWRRQQRKAEAQRASTTRLRTSHEEILRAKPVKEGARKASRELPAERYEWTKPNGQPTKVKVQAGHLVGFLATRGIPRDPDKAMPILRQIVDRLDKEGADLPIEAFGALARAKYLLAHPEAFRNEPLWSAVDAYKAQAESLGYSERARVLPIAIEEGIRPPEQRLPSDLADKGLTIRRKRDGEIVEEPVEDVASLKQKIQQDSAALRRATKKGDGAAAAEIGARLGMMRRALRSELTPEERRDVLDIAKDEGLSKKETAALLSAARKDKAVREDTRREQEYLGEVEAARALKGYEDPAYSTRVDVLPRQAPDATATGAQISALGRMAGDRMESGKLLREGRTDERLDTLLASSIRAPVAKRNIFGMWRDFLTDRSVRLDDRVEFTGAELSRLEADGRINFNDYALVPRQLYKRAFDALKHRDSISDADVEQFPTRIGEAADAPLVAGRRYRIVPREALTELMSQTEKASAALHTLNRFNRFQSRLLLGTSPAWLAMQFLAEGAQATVAVGPVQLAKGIREARRLEREGTDEEVAGFAAMAGETPGVAISTGDLRTRLTDGDTADAAGALSLMNRTPAGRAAKSIAKLQPLGDVDRWKGGLIRRGVAAARINREINSYRASIGKLWRAEDHLFSKLKELPLQEQLTYFARNPKAARRIQGYVDDVMGNWTALTRYERLPAGLAIFYPFMRMSLRWTFKAFPDRHPIKASILYALAATNAEHLADLLQGEPSYFGQWAQVPLYTGDDEDEVRLIDLSRAAPGANAVVEALGDADDPLFALTRTLQPGIQSLLTLATGAQQFGERVEGTADKGLAALGQLLALPAPVRALDQLNVESDIPGLSELAGFLNRGEREDSLSRQLSEAGNEPLRLLFPPAPQRLQLARRKAAMSRAYDAQDESPQPPLPPEVWDAVFADGGVDWDAVERITARRKRADYGEDFLDALGREYGIPETELTDEQSRALRSMTGGILIPNERKRVRVRKAWP